ncbi:2-(1,2-epoxy-1,2-dihydrophenyl)acetyl-CoA isomerase [Bacillus sp. BGMRC 2118]|nr:2-(1,2-epoxy-1,2-dihydrophenyl)acetyl-CoA isomerase [Bacillus sp. BGMRC 2118]
MYDTIQYEIQNQIAWITLNRPDRLNAFNAQMNKEIAHALKSSEMNEIVRCIVMTGAGRAFCSGQDLEGVGEEMDHGEVLRLNYGPMIKQLAATEKPVIAGINGVAAGAGLSLALACDFRIASEKASMLQAFIHVGLIPDSGNLYTLPKLIGHAKALELAVLGEKVSADEAKNIGLVTKVVPVETFMEELQAFATRLASMPTKAIGLIKRSLQTSWSASYDEYLELEAQNQRIAGKTIDHQEGVTAFVEKRKPTFVGK